MHYMIIAIMMAVIAVIGMMLQRVFQGPTVYDLSLIHILLIFLDNSIKFSPEQSKIEVALLGSRLTVTDHGCGVKQEELPHVFDRFYKTRGETNKSGSGLGLAISKQISERHGIGLTMTSIPVSYTHLIRQRTKARTVIRSMRKRNKAEYK